MEVYAMSSLIKWCVSTCVKGNGKEKRFVFTNDLKHSRVGQVLIWTGRLFHRFKAATLKARSPLVLSLLLSTSRRRLADLSTLGGVWT